jgi:2-dehydro-3-deoxyphosphooctonate aldolase (KDO 8-P synthase)
MAENKDIFKYKTVSQPHLFIIAGPCVIESLDICLNIAHRLVKISETHKIDLIFKASYDKANRTSINSFRGPGRDEGLKILQKVKESTGLPILTDIHETIQVAEAAQVADILQIPAFLCRQTDLLRAAGASGKIVNIKKGQFLSPEEIKYSIDKAGPDTWITERGTFFGYNRLVVDFGGFPVLKKFGKPLIFDATHSVQQPGAGQGCSSGNRELALPLAKAAITMGADALFFEIHPQPQHALCDGPNSLQLDDFERCVPQLCGLFNFINDQNF